MTSTELILRCQYQGGQRHVVKGLFRNSFVKDLKEKIFHITDVPVELQRILIGFPPKEININNENASLSSIGIRTGETLIIEKDHHLQTSESRNRIITKLTRKTIPADNSCLFASISYVMLGNTSFSSELRKLIVETVSRDPVTFNEAFLGRSNKEYCEWISNPERWGGAIEISILSKYYETEINVVNTENGRIDQFGENENYSNRVFLIYDGIHYDPLVFNADGKPIQTVFNSKDDAWLAAAREVGDEARKMNQFTNVSKFKLRCITCGFALTGQEAALGHAKETGHTNFGEV
ncbi:ubiquitin thioesterase OTU1-like [Dendronephthya gigantea]|uniref:ubiquitin thioesterase OTU1-like n=1 Tax=Dendronephthya gigantea TaxID=151771 RepID=UPI0010699BB8|nr:ubiquitin thioesterase OTU1-like [Dendronephthya gigantea]